MALTVHNMCVKAKDTLKITGVPKFNAEEFAINLGQNNNYFTLHFGFDKEKSCTLTSPEKVKKTVSIKQGEEFEVHISFDNNKFEIKIPGVPAAEVSFTKYLNEITFIEVLNHVRITGINIKCQKK